MPTPKSSKTALLQNLIDENLRRVYDDTLREEVPDRFKELLEKLRAAGKPE